MNEEDQPCRSVLLLNGVNYCCQLPDGHVGRHMFNLTWNDEEVRYLIYEP